MLLRLPNLITQQLVVKRKARIARIFSCGRIGQKTREKKSNKFSLGRITYMDQ